MKRTQNHYHITDAETLQAIRKAARHKSTTRGKALYKRALRHAETLDGNALNLFGRIAAASMLKKSHSAGTQKTAARAAKSITAGNGNTQPTLAKLRADLCRDNIIIGMDDAAKLPDGSNVKAHESFSDALDLQHDAIAALLENPIYTAYLDVLGVLRAEYAAGVMSRTDYAAAVDALRRDKLPAGWAEMPYTVSKPARRVIVSGLTQKEVDKLEHFEEEVKPAQSAFRAVSAGIRSNASVKVASNKYTYIEYQEDTNGNSAISGVYERQLAYTMGNNDGTADAYTVKTVAELVNFMELSDKELELLQYRMRGLGHKAISDIMGIAVGTVKSRFRLLQAKARKKLTEYIAAQEEKRRIYTEIHAVTRSEKSRQALEIFDFKIDTIIKLLNADYEPEMIVNCSMNVDNTYYEPCDGTCFYGGSWGVPTVYTVHAVTRTAHKVTPPKMAESRVKIHFGSIRAAAAFKHDHKITPPPLEVYTLNTSIVYRGTNTAAAADMYRRAADSTDTIRTFTTAGPCTIA